MAFRAAEYTRFAGERGSSPAWIAIWRATFRRGWASAWVRRLTMGAILTAGAITFIIYIFQTVVPDWRMLMEEMGENVRGRGPEFSLDSRIYLVFLQLFIYPFLLPLSVLMGYDLIAGDLRSNALETYFSRPITPWGYLFGRTAAYTAFLLLVTLVPMLWLWGFDVTTAPEGHFDKVSQVPLGMTLAMGLVALTLALFIQALTTITRNGLWTALVVVILFIFSGILGPVLYELTNNPSLQAAAFWENIWVLTNGCLGFPEETAGRAPFTLSLSIFVGIAVVSLLFLLRRIRKGGQVG
ncbi:MAG: hypothetical protein DWQ01_03840 [Planctomycetota bacterium]|nr:MAG: hypothetical protein DWQ01_03840 [Planctomycetota bacterium]